MKLDPNLEDARREVGCTPHWREGHVGEGRRGGVRGSHTIARIIQRMAVVLFIASLALLTIGITQSDAHQDPCHRLHSCPSDHNTFVCGDKGRCDQCPDNHFCVGGKPRTATQSPPPSIQPSPTQTQAAAVKRGLWEPISCLLIPRGLTIHDTRTRKAAEKIAYLDDNDVVQQFGTFELHRMGEETT